VLLDLAFGTLAGLLLVEGFLQAATLAATESGSAG
jgi:hypothetical protein